MKRVGTKGMDSTIEHDARVGEKPTSLEISGPNPACERGSDSVISYPIPVLNFKQNEFTI